MVSVWFPYHFRMVSVWKEYGNSMRRVWRQYADSIRDVWEMHSYGIPDVSLQYQLSIQTVCPRYQAKSIDLQQAINNICETHLRNSVQTLCGSLWLKKNHFNCCKASFNATKFTCTPGLAVSSAYAILPLPSITITPLFATPLIPNAKLQKYISYS